MLRDTNHQQVIQKFSFIENLNSRKNQSSQSEHGNLVTDEAFKFQHQQAAAKQNLIVKTEAKQNQGSMIMPTFDKSSTVTSKPYQPNSPACVNLVEAINAAPADSTKHNLATEHSYLGKILFALASSYCLFVLWWLFGDQGNRVLIMLSGGKQVLLSKPDVQFIDYMERSLDKIDRQLEAKRTASDKDEIVYVPVYTPTSATPQVPLTASSSSYPPGVPQSEPAPQTLKIPAPPPLPAPTPIAEQSGQNQIATASKPDVSHTLIGILELGEGKSAALVKVQGQTRRVWLGEEINTAGWILESVGNQRAKISYQGQVRSIAVGETF